MPSFIAVDTTLILVGCVMVQGHPHHMWLRPTAHPRPTGNPTGHPRRQLSNQPRPMAARHPGDGRRPSSVPATTREPPYPHPGLANVALLMLLVLCSVSAVHFFGWFSVVIVTSSLGNSTGHPPRLSSNQPRPMAGPHPGGERRP